MRDKEFTVSVKNTDKRGSEEVVRLYISCLGDPNDPIKSLRGFKHMALQAGEQCTVTLNLPHKSFEHFNEQINAIHVAPGEYRIYYGTSSDEADLQSLIYHLQ